MSKHKPFQIATAVPSALIAASAAILGGDTLSRPALTEEEKKVNHPDSSSALFQANPIAKGKVSTFRLQVARSDSFSVEECPCAETDTDLPRF